MREPTLDECCALTSGASMWSTLAVADAGIPSFTMSDGPMGIASRDVDERDVSLLTPCPMALGASWDPALSRRVAQVVGGEAVLRNIDALLAPTLNLARSPLAGRAFEYFSEDPLLTGVLGAAWIEGLQSTGTGAIAKHMVCNDSETDRDTIDVRVDERTLREVYLLPYQFAVEAGCAGLLAAYNRVNGAWSTEEAHVLTDIVKNEWGFSRLIVSDWFATHSGEGAINAGLDLEMPGPGRFMGDKLKLSVEVGSVDRDRVVDAANRVAATARMVAGKKAASLPIEEAAAILEEAAGDGMVLLRNEGSTLPLVPSSLKRLAVIGPNAAAPCYQGGTFAKIAVAPGTATPVEGIRSVYGEHCEVLFEPGVDPQPRLPTMPTSPTRDLGDGCQRGMTLDYFATPDCTGDPVFSETRDTNSLCWFTGQHKQTRFDVPGSIRASGRFTAAASGVHRFYLGATGPAHITVDGRELLSGGAEIATNDVMGVLKSGDADFADVQLEAGQTVTVVAELHFRPARVQGLWYGIRVPDSPDAMLARAVAAARDADAVILVVGETSDSSVESKDRPDTRLPAEQLRLIEAVTAANPRTIAVVNVGHAFDAAWGGLCAALLVAWYPGQGFAGALARILAGEREPGGRMPVSIARNEADYTGYGLTPDARGQLHYSEGTLLGYRGLVAADTPALHPFGSGQGYARFDWDEIALDGDTVSLRVRNTSERAGADVVQVYRTQPECALVAFAKVKLGPGETTQIKIPLETRLLKTWENGWHEIRGQVDLRVARSSDDPGFQLQLVR